MLGQPFLWPHYLPSHGEWVMVSGGLTLPIRCSISLQFPWPEHALLWFWAWVLLSLICQINVQWLRLYNFQCKSSQVGLPLLSLVEWLCSPYRMSLSCSCLSGHFTTLLLQLLLPHPSSRAAHRVGPIFQDSPLLGDPWQIPTRPS